MPDLGVGSNMYQGEKFDGSTSSIKVLRAAVLEPTTYITAEVRLEMGSIIASQPTTYPVILQKYVWADNKGYGIFMDQALKLIYFRVYISGWKDITYDISGWNISTIHHVAGVYDGSNAILYIDGVNVNSLPATGAITQDTAQDLNIGAYGANAAAVSLDWFQGFIDEIRIWSTARTQSQIQTNMSSEIDPGSTGLIGYWKLNETSGTTALDSTTNGNNGTITSCTRQFIDYRPIKSQIQVTAKNIKANRTQKPSPAKIYAIGLLSAWKTYTYSITPTSYPDTTPVSLLTNNVLSDVVGWNIGTSGGTFTEDIILDLGSSQVINSSSLWYGTAYSQPNYNPEVVQIQTSPDNITYTTKATVGILGTSLPGFSKEIRFDYHYARYIKFHLTKLEQNLHDWLFINEIQTSGSAFIISTQHATMKSIVTSAKSPTRVGITKAYPTRAQIQVTAKNIKANRTQLPTRTQIQVTAKNPARVGITKVYPTRAQIQVTAKNPARVGITKVYPTRTQIQVTAKNIKANRTQKPIRTQIQVTAKNIQTNRIQKPTRTQIQVTAHAPASVMISKVYTTRARIQVTAKTATLVLGTLTIHTAPAIVQVSARTIKINRNQYLTSALIHASVSAPSIRLTQHTIVSVVHLAAPPPIIVLIQKPIPAVIHFVIPSIQGKLVVHPNPACIHVLAKASIIYMSRIVNVTNATVHFSAQNPHFIGQQVHPPQINILVQAKTPKIIQVQHAQPAVIHFSARGIMGALVIKVTRARIQLIVPSPKIPFSVKPNPAVFHFIVPNPGISNYVRPIATIIHIQAKAPTIIKGTVTKTPSPSIIHFTAETIKLNQVIRPARANIIITANAVHPVVRVFPTPAIINLAARAVIVVKGTYTIHPSAAQIHFQAQGIIAGTVIKPTHAIIQITAKTVKTNQIVKPNKAQIIFLLPAPTITKGSVAITAGTATAHFSARTSKITFTQKPTASVAHFNAKDIVTLNTIKPARALIHFIMPGPKIKTSISVQRCVINLSARNVTLINAYVVKPTAASIQLSLPTPTIVLGVETVHPARCEIHFHVHGFYANYVLYPPANIIHSQLPAPILINTHTIYVTKADIQVTAKDPKIILTQKPNPAVIHFFVPLQQTGVIKPPPLIIHTQAQGITTLQTIKPIAVIAHFSAGNIKANLTVKPTASVISVTAITPIIVKGIITVHPTHATIHLTANGVVTNRVVRPTHANITLSMPTPTLIKSSITIHAGHAIIHMSAQNATVIIGTYTIHATRAAIHVTAAQARTKVTSYSAPTIIKIDAKNPRQVGLSVSPSRAVIHLTMPTPTITRGGTTVHVSRAAIHLSVPTQYPIITRIKYVFNVKIWKELNLTVVISNKLS